jgi:hypothetical protein
VWLADRGRTQDLKSELMRREEEHSAALSAQLGAVALELGSQVRAAVI